MSKRGNGVKDGVSSYGNELLPHVCSASADSNHNFNLVIGGDRR